MTAQIMDIVRGKFLEKQLNLPTEIVSIIRGYDSIYRDYFSKNIVMSLNINVNTFWNDKILIYTGKRSNLYKPDYVEKLNNYYFILWNILTIDPINYNDESGCGLFMFD